MKTANSRAWQFQGLAVIAAVTCVWLSEPAFSAEAEKPVSNLIYQVTFGSSNEVRDALRKSPQPNIANEENVPILSVAARRRDDEGIRVMTALIEAGANVNIADSQGQTPLFYAARRGNIPGIRLLLAKGAEYYHADTHGDTARNIAFSMGFNDVVQEIDGFVKSENARVLGEYKKYYHAVKKNNDEIAEQQAREAELIRARQEAEALRLKSENEARARFEAEAQSALARAQEASEQARLIAQKNKEKEIADSAAAASANAAAAAEQAAKTQAELAAKAAAEAKEKQEQEAKALEEKRKPARLRTLVHDLSMDYCVRQYWQYTRLANMNFDNVTPAQVTEKIQTREDSLLETSKTIMTDFALDDKFLAGIADPSQQYIVKTLDAMVSNRNRKANGVGTAGDDESRCEQVAGSFALDYAAMSKKPEKK